MKKASKLKSGISLPLLLAFACAGEMGIAANPPAFTHGSASFSAPTFQPDLPKFVKWVTVDNSQNGFEHREILRWEEDYQGGRSYDFNVGYNLGFQTLATKGFYYLNATRRKDSWGYEVVLFDYAVRNANQLSQASGALFANVKVQMRFDRVTPDWKSIGTRIRITSENFRKILVSGRNYIEYQVNFGISACDEEPIKSVSAGNETIENIVIGFHETDVDREFSYCELKAESVVPLDNFRDNLLISKSDPDTDRSEEYRLDTARFAPVEQASLKVMEDGNVIFGSKPEFLAYLKPLVPQKTGSGNQIALASARRFIGLLKDYSEKMILSRDKSDLERGAFFNAYVGANKDSYQTALSSLLTNYASLSIVEKTAILRAVRVAYDHAHFLEEKLAKDGAGEAFDKLTQIRVNAE